MKIANNTVVTVDFRLTDGEGSEIDSSEGGEAIVYLHGADELLEQLESALEGRNPGDELSVTVQPEDAYGEELPELIRSFHIDEFNGIEMEPGMELQGKDPDGNFRVLRVQRVEGEQVSVNMNHPLAGKVLNFDLRIRDVRAATEEEIAHGHVHH